MIEALVALDRLAEMRQSFIGDALASAAEIDAGVALFTMQDVHEYIVNEAAVKAASIKKQHAYKIRSAPRSRRTREGGYPALPYNWVPTYYGFGLHPP